MLDRKSLVAQLGWRLATVLTLATAIELAWLFYHFRGADSSFGAGSLRYVIFDFFVDVAWTLPVIGIVTFLVCAAGMRRHLAPLKQLSEQASRIEPGHKFTSLSLVDIPSEVRPLVASVNAGFERLVGAVEVQRRFTANAAHELRTPLSILQAGLERPPNGTEVTALREEVRRTGRIVSQLLSLARLEGNNGDRIVAIDLIAATLSVMTALAPLGSVDKVTLAFDSVSERVPISATQEAVEEIVRNLVENAIAHAPAGSEVAVYVDADGTLTVTDLGPGIPEANRGHVFERFWRGKWSATQGSGLGLAIVAEACQRIGAKAVCAPHRKGGRFCVAFVKVAAE
jgi:signal transduction histidine kinase